MPEPAMLRQHAEIVLASASATRRRLLAAAGIVALSDPAALDEGEIRAAFKAEGASALDCAAALAEGKALRVSARHPDALVIGADQILDCGGTWFEKAADRAAAQAHLRALRGKTHSLAGAVAIAQQGRIIWQARSAPRLAMRAFSDAFLETYLDQAGDAVLQSVGAYELEGLGIHLFAKIEGDYFAILGLPLLPLLAFLRDRGALAP
jgi:septum formation protein